MMNEIPLAIIASLVAALIVLSSWILRIPSEDSNGTRAQFALIAALGLSVFSCLVLMRVTVDVAWDFALPPAASLIGAALSMLAGSLWLRRAER
ncbi:MAG: hypothetical protein GX614_03795 [Sandaracinaceae bacterium]|nr:hypothetical protein [Sandaracinaceae bacterium]